MKHLAGVKPATEVTAPSVKTQHEAFAGPDELRYTGFTPQ